jgi:hypothetical protein
MRALTLNKIPYQKKNCRQKVTKFWLGDEHGWCFHVTHTIIKYSSCYVRTWVVFSCNTHNYQIFVMLCTVFCYLFFRVLRV